MRRTAEESLAHARRGKVAARYLRVRLGSASFPVRKERSAAGDLRLPWLAVHPETRL